MIDISDAHLKLIDKKSFRYIKELRKDDLSTKELAGRLKRINRKNDICFALFYNDDAIAEATITLKSNDPNAAIENVKAYMSGLFVKKDARRSGSATKLLNCIKDELHKTGYSLLTVIVDNSNENAMNFYKKSGFVHEKTYDMDDTIFSLMVLPIIER